MRARLTSAGARATAAEQFGERAARAAGVRVVASPSRGSKFAHSSTSWRSSHGPTSRARQLYFQAVYVSGALTQEAERELEILEPGGIFIRWVSAEGVGVVPSPDGTLLIVGDEARGVQVIGVNVLPPGRNARLLARKIAVYVRDEIRYVVRRR
jgi:hypothetical protein